LTDRWGFPWICGISLRFRQDRVRLRLPFSPPCAGPSSGGGKPHSPAKTWWGWGGYVRYEEGGEAHLRGARTSPSARARDPVEPDPGELEEVRAPAASTVIPASAEAPRRGIHPRHRLIVKSLPPPNRFPCLARTSRPSSARIDSLAANSRAQKPGRPSLRARPRAPALFLGRVFLLRSTYPAGNVGASAYPWPHAQLTYVECKRR
jgi:hypothetical protein